MRVVVVLVIAPFALAVGLVSLISLIPRHELIESREWDPSSRTQSDFVSLPVRGWPLPVIIYSPHGPKFMLFNTAVDLALFFPVTLACSAIWHELATRRARRAT